MPPGEPGFFQLAPVLVRKYTFQIKIIKNATPGAWIFLVLVRKYTFSNKKFHARSPSFTVAFYSLPSTQRRCC